MWEDIFPVAVFDEAGVMTEDADTVFGDVVLLLGGVKEDMVAAMLLGPPAESAVLPVVHVSVKLRADELGISLATAPPLKLLVRPFRLGFQPSLFLAVVVDDSRICACNS